MRLWCTALLVSLCACLSLGLGLGPWSRAAPQNVPHLFFFGGEASTAQRSNGLAFSGGHEAMPARTAQSRMRRECALHPGRNTSFVQRMCNPVAGPVVM